MIKRQIFGILWVIAVIVALYVFVDQKIIKTYFPSQPTFVSVDSAPAVEEVKREVTSAPPLRATTTQSAPKTKITTSQIIALTNIERQKIGLPALGENTMLDDAALAKAKDMLAKQYFEHVSPSGENARSFATKEGYEYLIIGENLALGGFKDAKALVGAWMASPGHRENILNSKYREMGASALLGKFEGHNTLFAVQIFGTPSAVCPKIDNTFKAKIDELNTIISAKKQVLDAMFQELNSSPRNKAYNNRVAEYNILVDEYNDFVAEAKSMITVYNDQVRQFTDCVASLR